MSTEPEREGDGRERGGRGAYLAPEDLSSAREVRLYCLNLLHLAEGSLSVTVVLPPSFSLGFLWSLENGRDKLGTTVPGWNWTAVVSLLK